MVESIRASRPPRMPTTTTGSVRQLPLGPVHIERDASLEARVEELERSNAKLMEATVLFKRQAGKYLVKKRLADKGRVKAEEKVQLLWGEVGRRGGLYGTLVEEFEELVENLRGSVEEKRMDDVEQNLNGIQRAIDRSKMKSAELMQWTRMEEKKVFSKNGGRKAFRAGKAGGQGFSPSVRRDDTKSVYSVASTVVDEEAVTEMVAFLESRLPKSHPAVERARDALSKPTFDVDAEKDALRKEHDFLREELARSKLTIGKMMKERDMGRRGVGRQRWSDRKDTSGVTSRGSEAMRKVAEWRKRIEEQQKDPKFRTGESHQAGDESVGLSPQLVPPERELQSRGGSVVSMPVAHLFRTPSVSSLGSEGLGKLTATYKVDSSRKLFHDSRKSKGLSGLFDGLD